MVRANLNNQPHRRKDAGSGVNGCMRLLHMKPVAGNAAIEVDVCFSLNPISGVRGETESTEPRSLDSATEHVSSNAAIDQLMAQGRDPEVMSFVLRPRLNGAVYAIRCREQGHARWATADARSGVIRDPLGEAEAVAVARLDFSEPADILAGDPITETPAAQSIEAALCRHTG
jgi:hypothetical protein